MTSLCHKKPFEQLHIETRKYRNIVSKIKPLDLLLFRGCEIQCKGIVFVQFCKVGFKLPFFSHAAIIVNKALLPHIHQLKEDKLYVWECTAGQTEESIQYKATDIESHNTVKSGVQIRELLSVIKYCKSINELVAWCPLIHNPWDNVSNRHMIISKLNQLHKHHGHCGYDFNAFDMFGAVFKSIRIFRDFTNNCLWDIVFISNNCCDCVGASDSSGHKKDDKILQKPISVRNPLQRFFCSEWVACIYEKIGMFPKHFDVRNYAPFHVFGISTSIPQMTNTVVYIAESL